MVKALAAAGLIIYHVCRHSKPALSNAFRYLLLQTSDGEHHWTPPKGHVHPGEDLLATAYRETFEESGLSKSCLKIITDFSPVVLKYDVKGKTKTVTYWLAVTDDSAIIRLSDEHQDYRWFDIDQACRAVGFLDMQSVLRQVHKHLTDHAYHV